MMKVPREDWSKLLKWSHMAIASDEPEWQIGTAEETRREGFVRISSYCLEHALARRGQPVADLLGAMGNAEVNGRKWNEREITFNGVLTVLGGIDTTRNTTAGAMLELIRNPDEMARVKADPGLLRTLIEEALRWTSPIAHVRREATREVEIRGRKIRAGDWVVVWIASANRDEEVFADSDRFDVGRTPNGTSGLSIRRALLPGRPSGAVGTTRHLFRTDRTAARPAARTARSSGRNPPRYPVSSICR